MIITKKRKLKPIPIWSIKETHNFFYYFFTFLLVCVNKHFENKLNFCKQNVERFSNPLFANACILGQQQVAILKFNVQQIIYNYFTNKNQFNSMSICFYFISYKFPRKKSKKSIPNNCLKIKYKLLEDDCDERADLVPAEGRTDGQTAGLMSGWMCVRKRNVFQLEYPIFQLPL